MFVGSPNSTAATAVPTLTSVTSLGQAARLKYWSWTTRYFQLRLPRQQKKNFSSSDWFPSWRTWKSLTQNWNKSGVIYFEYGVEAWMCLFGWYFLTVCALKTDFILNTYRHYQVYSSDNTNRATPLIIYWLYRAVHKYSPIWTFPHFVAGSPFDQRTQTIWIFLPILLGGKKKALPPSYFSVGVGVLRVMIYNKIRWHLHNSRLHSANTTSDSNWFVEPELILGWIIMHS